MIDPNNLPPFMMGPYLFLPYSFVRACGDSGSAVLLAILVGEAEKNLTSEWVPHDAEGTYTRLGWTKTYHSGRLSALKTKGFLSHKLVSGVRQVKLDLTTLQSTIDRS